MKNILITAEGAREVAAASVHPFRIEEAQQKINKAIKEAAAAGNHSVRLLELNEIKESERQVIIRFLSDAGYALVQCKYSGDYILSWNP